MKEIFKEALAGLLLFSVITIGIIIIARFILIPLFAFLFKGYP